MKVIRFIAMILAVAVSAAALPQVSFAQQGEQDRALELRRQSDLIPYNVIAARAVRQFGGRVVGQRVRDMDGRIVYELRLLKEDGNVLIVFMDAKTGRVIRTKGR